MLFLLNTLMVVGLCRCFGL